MCERCLKSFECGAGNSVSGSTEKCWCFTLPAMNLKPEFKDCLCPNCLNILAQENLQKEEDFYFNENGLMVMTAAYHLKRGFCCGNGCRHCPYPKKD